MTTANRVLAIAALTTGVLAAAGCNRNAEPVTDRRPADAPTPASAPMPAPSTTPAAAEAPHPMPPDDPTVAEFLGLTAPTPEAWVWELPESPMRAANYKVAETADGEDVQLVVFFFGPSMGGGIEDNISRWAGQFRGGVEPDVEQGTVDGMPMTRVEITGAYGGMSGQFKDDHTFLAAIVEAPAGRVFIRLVGPTDIVEQHREAFERMIDGIRKAETG